MSERLKYTRKRDGDVHVEAQGEKAVLAATKLLAPHVQSQSMSKFKLVLNSLQIIKFLGWLYSFIRGTV